MALANLGDSTVGQVAINQGAFLATHVLFAWALEKAREKYLVSANSDAPATSNPSTIGRLARGTMKAVGQYNAITPLVTTSRLAYRGAKFCAVSFRSLLKRG